MFSLIQRRFYTVLLMALLFASTAGVAVAQSFESISALPAEPEPNGPVCGAEFIRAERLPPNRLPIKTRQWIRRRNRC